MKRIITLALAAGLFMGATAPSAQAVDFRVQGFMTLSGQVSDGLEFVQGDDSGFQVYQRVQLGLDIIASENLMARMVLRAPNNATWGHGYGIGGVEGAVKIREAYIDWLVPNTDVKVSMGLHPVALPLYLGSANPVFDDTVPGVTVSGAVNDNFGYSLSWARIASSISAAASVGTEVFDANGTSVGFFGASPASTSSSGAADMFALQLPISYDTFSITPWAAYAMFGNDVVGTISKDKNNTFSSYLAQNAGEEYSSLNAYWLGFTTQFNMIDNLAFGVDALYSGARFEGAHNNDNSDGWMIDAYAAYASSFGNTSLAGWYASGDSNDGSDANYSQSHGRFLNIAGGWGTTKSAFFDQANTMFLPTSGVTTPTGTWGIALAHNGWAPVEKLSLGAHIMYVRGTNNSYGIFEGGPKDFTPQYLTTGDSVTELAVYGSYAIYKELQATFDINYLIANIDDAWKNSEAKTNGFRTGVGFKYSF